MVSYRQHLHYAERVLRRFGLGLTLVYCWNAVHDPLVLADWIDFVSDNIPGMLQDGFIVRIMRPYMRLNFTMAQKYELLRTHYTTIAQHFGKTDALRGEPGLLVTRFKGKSGSDYTVHVGVSTSKEGELSFSMYDMHGYLAKLAASVGPDELGRKVLWIGGLQGPKPPMGREKVVHATRDLYGLRPKGAVMLATQYFAQMLGLEAIRAPASEAHISRRSLKFLRLKKRVIYADYGQFWQELGGTRIGADEYVLPVVPQQRDVSEVKPNKRSEWKKRHALSEQLTHDLRVVLAAQQVVALAPVEQGS